jgi:hypothetical protein
VTYGADNAGTGIPLQQVIPAILQELSGPNCVYKQIGNTLFIVHPDKDGKAFFRALNADIAQNYINNSRQFCVWAKKELGLSFLVTQFKGREIEMIAKSISRNPPMPGMEYQILPMKSGETRLVLILGPAKG